MEMKKVDYILEIDILRNSSQNNWVSCGVLSKGLGVQKDTQTPCWLRPWMPVIFTIPKADNKWESIVLTKLLYCIIYDIKCE